MVDLTDVMAEDADPFDPDFDRPDELAADPVNADERAAWVGFNLVSGIGPAGVDRLLQIFGNLADAWAAPTDQLRRVFSGSVADAFGRVRADGTLERTLDRMAETGIRAVIRPDDDYPTLLREIPAPPPLLYVRGTLLLEDRTAVAVVGTRKLTAYGREVCGQIAAGLASAGVTVISGLAMGIDGVAHRAALDAGGRTIAVKGCGIADPYPYAHRHMAEEIVVSGALVSEYPPDRKADASTFPARNRIISGLSLGTIVVEAPERSGALITTSFAADQGREVFVVPGNVTSAMSAGCLSLLRDGARLVRSADDVLEDLNIGPRARVVARQPALPVDESEQVVLSYLTWDPQHIDELSAMLDLPVYDLATRLMMLELKGAVRNTGAQHYALA